MELETSCVEMTIKSKTEKFYKLTVSKLLHLWNLPKSVSSNIKIPKEDKYYSTSNTEEILHVNITKVIRFLLQIDKGALPVGIFRKCGNNTKSKALKKYLSSTSVNDVSLTLDLHDVHDLASALKELLNEYQIFPNFVKQLVAEDLLFDLKHTHTDFSDRSSTAIKWLNLLLTKEKRAVLHLLIKLCKHIVGDTQTLMTYDTLATLFVPCTMLGEDYAKCIAIGNLNKKPGTSMSDIINGIILMPTKTLEELMKTEKVNETFNLKELTEIGDQLGHTSKFWNIVQNIPMFRQTGMYNFQKRATVDDLIRTVCTKKYFRKNSTT